jgi:predicted transcriptional regulator YdeE
MSTRTLRVLAISTALVVFSMFSRAIAVSAHKHPEPAFSMIGLQVRTNNAREASPEGLIGKQWQRLYREGLLAKIPKRADEAVIALYTGYASNEHGDYTYVLGARVTSCSEVPVGMTCRRVPSGKYVTLESDTGAIPGIVIALWQKVWNSKPEQLGGDRSFRNDYELYDSRASDPAHARVELHLGVR